MDLVGAKIGMGDQGARDDVAQVASLRAPAKAAEWEDPAVSRKRLASELNSVPETKSVKTKAQKEVVPPRRCPC